MEKSFQNFRVQDPSEFKQSGEQKRDLGSVKYPQHYSLQKDISMNRVKSESN